MYATHALIKIMLHFKKMYVLILNLFKVLKKTPIEWGKKERSDDSFVRRMKPQTMAGRTSASSEMYLLGQLSPPARLGFPSARDSR